MNRYEEGLKVIEERCGNGKDNILSLATIAMEPNVNGQPRPYIRDVDAYYADGVWDFVNKVETEEGKIQ